MAEFNQAYKIVHKNEGGYANDPKDRGGETYKGISRVHNPNWSGWAKVDAAKPLKNNDVIKDEELDKSVVEFYKKTQWDAIKGDDIQNQEFANFLMDFYVTSGGNANKQLQRILGLEADGKFGSGTLKALTDSDLNDVYEKFYQARIDYYKNISVQKPEIAKFLGGWLKRVKSFPDSLGGEKKKNKKDAVDIKGDASTKADIPTKAKAQKEAKIAQVKSEIKPKSIPEKKIKTPSQPCPLNKGVKPFNAKRSKAAAENKIACNLGGLTVAKDGGKYTLIVKAMPKSSVSGDLEIVAGYNKRKANVKCSVTGIAGPCAGKHKTKVVDFTDPSTQKTDTKLDFEAGSKYAFNYFPWNPTTNSYRLSANTCGAGVGASVKVFPDTYWHIKVTSTMDGMKLDEIQIEGDFKEDQNSLTFSASTSGEISFEHENDSSKTALEASEKGFKAGHKSDTKTIGFIANDDKVESYYNNKNTKTESHVSFDTKAAEYGESDEEGETVKAMSITSGDDFSHKIEAQLKKNIDGLFRAVKIAKFIDGLIEKIAKGGSPVELEIKWPNIEFEGTWQWKEIDGQPKCGFEYNIEGGLHPLIGSAINVDLIGAVLLSIPGYGTLANAILNSIEYISGNDLALNLQLTGDVNFDFNVSKKAAAASATITAPKTHVDLILTLSASMKLKEENFILGYGGGVEGSAKVVIDVHKPIILNEGIDLPCDYKFTGLTISSITYKKKSSFWSSIMPDEDEEIKEEKKKLGNWLEGESHSFSLPLI